MFKKEGGYMFDSYFDFDNLWTYGVLVVVANTLMAWVRNLAKFSVTFLFANLLILLTVIISCSLSVSKIYSNGIKESVVLVNTSNMFNMLGFAIYTYEGIGIVMPCM